ncbi:MAG: TonB-dependent receptor [Sphingobium sp.]|jgi:iron complex outermembrane recepter protein|uniref:TonB-dependent receptor n=1 Tax=Sphingobium TaxID=165695 RepID=UPI0002F8327C|nr:MULTISPECIES: TonB-dependent receptor [Sphingobium]MBU0660371.1 TonB-dependent receptor [Alphaproteobacteria bacterium]MBA4756460.1 TonB-dependent receptor [Sphingobium sp.]MBS51038.1 TonB-dependent receptor [Sphingobium sp.]MBU0867662.1 TonB-dependent receptor [Alphaproteobacteria bacterium]MBU1795571.1 TonB-dependent receptor [Alphaproteobacteria bacterium]
MRGISGFILPLGLLLTTSEAALAQSSNAAPQEGATSDIVVTARRTAENIQETPVSVVAFGADSLRQANIRDTQDLLVKTPGVFLAGSGGRENTNFSIRGQSKALAGNSAPGVISYFAEVPSPTVGSSIPTYDLSSVQVLKGPQGTLFGRNTTGGAILYYPTAPDYKLGGYAKASYGNYDARLLEAAVNIPLTSDTLAIRIAGQIQKRDGWTKNIGIGGDPDDLNSRAIRGSILFEPSATFRNTLIVDYYHNDAVGGASVLTDVLPGPNGLTATGTANAALAQLALQRARGPRVINSDVDAFEKVERFGITNRTEFDLSDDITFINIFGYRRTKIDYYSSVDGLPTLIADGSGAIPAGLPVTIVGGRQTSDVRQISDEVQLKGSALGNRLDWLVGAFYLDSKPLGPSGTYIPVFTLPGITDARFNYSFYSEKSRALFGNVNYEIADGLHVNLGVRHTWDKIEACVGGGLSNQPVVSPEECAGAATTIRNSSVNKTSSKALTWQLGVDWKASDAIFLYAVSRRGYRAGGINSPTLAGRLAQFQSFAPEKVTDVEVGIRSDFTMGDVELQFNASPFVGWYNNVQVPISGLNTQASCSTTAPGGTNPPRSPDGDCDASNDPSGGTLLVNAGKTRVAGIDLSTRIQPTSTLSFDAGATFLDLKSRSLTVPAALQSYLAALEVPFNLVAKTTVTAGLRWTLPVPLSLAETVASLDYYHSSKVRSSDQVLPAYDLVNGRLDLNGVGGSNADISFFVRNLFDKKYLASSNVGSAALGIFSGFYGAPRTYGVEVRYRFGD